MSRRIFGALLALSFSLLASLEAGGYGTFSGTAWRWYDDASDNDAEYPVDLTYFQASSSASGFSFELKFATLTSQNNRVLPLIQIGIDSKSSGIETLYDQNAGITSETAVYTPYTNISLDHLVYAWQYSASTNTLFSEQDLVGFRTAETASWSTLSLAIGSTFEYDLSSNTIRIFLPFGTGSIGSNTEFRNNRVGFAVGIFISSSAVNGTVSSNVIRLIGNKPNFADAVSIHATGSETSDGILDFDFFLNFDNDFLLDPAPVQVTAFSMEGLQENTFLAKTGETAHQPVLVWDFTSSDGVNLPFVYNLQLSPTSGFGSYTEEEGYIEEENIDPDSGLLKVTMKSSLSQNTTHYLRARIMDRQGTFSDFSSTLAFFARSSAVESVTGENWIKAVYNNPVPAGGKTIFAYSVKDFDQPVTIRIYSLTGKHVRTLLENTIQREGTSYLIEWDTEDTAGEPAEPGLYYVLMEAGDVEIETAMTRVVISKNEE
ncbi:MAG TPA: hypothetical protein VJC03_04565 [bacterium]|nr:hypothetical protein [bacterium]